MCHIRIIFLLGVCSKINLAQDEAQIYADTDPDAAMEMAMEPDQDMSLQDEEEYDPDSEAWKYSTVVPGQTLPGEDFEDEEIVEAKKSTVDMANPFDVDLVPYNYWTGKMYEEEGDGEEPEEEITPELSTEQTETTESIQVAPITTGPSLIDTNLHEAVAPRNPSASSGSITNFIQNRLKAGRNYLAPGAAAPKVHDHSKMMMKAAEPESETAVTEPETELETEPDQQVLVRPDNIEAMRAVKWTGMTTIPPTIITTTQDTATQNIVLAEGEEYEYWKFTTWAGQLADQKEGYVAGSLDYDDDEEGGEEENESLTTTEMTTTEPPPDRTEPTDETDHDRGLGEEWLPEEEHAFVPRTTIATTTAVTKSLETEIADHETTHKILRKSPEPDPKPKPWALPDPQTPHGMPWDDDYAYFGQSDHPDDEDGVSDLDYEDEQEEEVQDVEDIYDIPRPSLSKIRKEKNEENSKEDSKFIQLYRVVLD